MTRKKCPPTDDPTMSGCRSRNEGSGQLRAKRGDTRVGTIEAQYGIDLAMRSDAHLDAALERYRVGSLNQLVKAIRSGRK